MNPIPFIPEKRENVKVVDVVSAWGNIPSILQEIITRFDVKQNTALEFGVEYGYSTSAISNYFEKVIGVDTFEGDSHAGLQQDSNLTFQQTKQRLLEFPNIEVIKESYQDYILRETATFDLIHVDIIHDYHHTYECGDWSVKHSPVVIFHDTLSFPEVMQVCLDLSNKYDLDFYNYSESNGLGILVNKSFLNT